MSETSATIIAALPLTLGLGIAIGHLVTHWWMTRQRQRSRRYDLTNVLR